jgi:AcrR family transcriptional regulator
MITEAPGSSPAGRERLSREAWLEKALEVLSRDGESKVRIDSVCAALGVTKGSFYWHFKGRDDFLETLFDYWTERFNRRVPESTKAHGGTASERIRFLFKLVTRENLGKYDAAFDSWAAHEPATARRVKEVYRLRYDYVASLFRELGFRGVALEVRTVAFLSFLKVESRVTGKAPPRRNARRIAIELEFFTRPS